MKIEEEDFEIHIARAVGNRLEDFLRNARERLWIVSPWISGQYAEFLLNKKKKGVDVQLVTTLDHINSNAFKKLIGKKQKVEKEKVLGGLFTRSKNKNYFVSKLGEENLVVFEKQKGRYRRMRFTHSKIYISDDKATIGSANLTESGLWNNVETLWITEDENVTEQICEAFKKIRNHPMLNKAPFNKVAGFAKIPEKEVKKEESKLDQLDKRLEKKANEIIGDIFS